MQPFADELDRLVPAGAERIDIHTHLGRDEDGMWLEPERLVEMLDDAGVGRAAVFALHDPERAPAFAVPNDRVVAWADRSAGRLVAFCRVDPQDGAVAEATRCLDAGARGIKLHPRAQGFDFAHSALDGIFRLAHERGVPILIHAGRGMAPIAAELCSLALAVPATVILAHGAIADQAIFATRLADHPAAFFDTSVFNPLDISELLARVPAERVVFGSDPPYGRPLSAAFATARIARSVGCDDEQTRLVMGGTAARILDGRPPAPRRPPPRSRRLEMDGALARVYSLTMGTINAAIAGGESPAEWVLQLAEAACREPDPDRAGATLNRIAGTLALARELMEGGRLQGAIALLWMSAVLAVSENADRV